MSSLFLHTTKDLNTSQINICGSKSESNRLLILNALYDEALDLKNLSNSDDTEVLKKALQSQSNVIDVHHAGTAMRFLTAYFSIQSDREIILTGSARMKQRPIGILVDALRTLGAEISYLEEPGFPPLKIKGKNLVKNKVDLQSNTSSQFITALLLIGSKFPTGLEINLIGKITSQPYLMMTIEMLRQIGIEIKMEGNKLFVFPTEFLKSQNFEIESDWSSVSYFYSAVAISENLELKISTFKSTSLQGDSALSKIYRTHFGVETEFTETEIVLTKIPDFERKSFEINLNNTPDIAQTIAVTSAALKIPCKLTGLETLKIKETDRLFALQTELKKLGVICDITNESLEISAFGQAESIPKIATYDDHRMAMSFAPMALKTDLIIENPEVVAKSYPEFWNDFEKLGFPISK